MVRRMLYALAAGLASATPALADDVTPGTWDITMESRVPADSGWAPSPFSITQCLTAADARDPSRLIGSIATPGATGCDYTERNYSGGTFRFALACTGAFAIQAKGSVEFSAERFEGTITATGNVAGRSVEFQNHVTGRRTGGC